LIDAERVHIANEISFVIVHVGGDFTDFGEINIAKDAISSNFEKAPAAILIKNLISTK
jgi:hypothetical protein